MCARQTSPGSGGGVARAASLQPGAPPRQAGRPPSAPSTSHIRWCGHACRAPASPPRRARPLMGSPEALASPMSLVLPLCSRTLTTSPSRTCTGVSMGLPLGFIGCGARYFCGAAGGAARRDVRQQGKESRGSGEGLFGAHARARTRTQAARAASAATYRANDERARLQRGMESVCVCVCRGVRGSAGGSCAGAAPRRAAPPRAPWRPAPHLGRRDGSIARPQLQPAEGRAERRHGHGRKHRGARVALQSRLQ